MSSVSLSSTSSTHRCTIPRPAGPSRMMVCGTMFHPSAAEMRYAARSRPARVPSGKSHSGCSPGDGLVDTVHAVIASLRLTQKSGIAGRSDPAQENQFARTESLVIRHDVARPVDHDSGSSSAPANAPRRYPLVRTQMCPSGSSGSSHSGQGGRPAEMT